MTTHRSLNKLEFKAHMSIHNVREVSEAETHESSLTRDRFGKSHPLSDSDGTPRLPRRQAGIRRGKAKKGLTAAALTALLLCSAAAADSVPPRRNTDIQVDSESLDADSWLNQKLSRREENFSVPIDESTSLGINDNGDPNLNTRF